MCNQENTKTTDIKSNSRDSMIGIKPGVVFVMMLFVLCCLGWLVYDNNGFLQEFLAKNDQSSLIASTIDKLDVLKPAISFSQYSTVASTIWTIVVFLSTVAIVVFLMKCLTQIFSQRQAYQQERLLLELKFEQEQKWQDIAKIKQERDDLKKKNEVLIAESKVAPVDQDILQREQQIIAMYLLALYNSKKISSDKNITSDEIKKILDESLESCKVIKNKITEIKDKGL